MWNLLFQGWHSSWGDRTDTYQMNYSMITHAIAFTEHLLCEALYSTLGRHSTSRQGCSRLQQQEHLPRARAIRKDSMGKEGFELGLGRCPGVRSNEKKEDTGAGDFVWHWLWWCLLLRLWRQVLMWVSPSPNPLWPWCFRVMVRVRFLDSQKSERETVCITSELPPQNRIWLGSKAWYSARSLERKRFECGFYKKSQVFLANLCDQFLSPSWW